jgi:hypothetical protein
VAARPSAYGVGERNRFSTIRLKEIFSQDQRPPVHVVHVYVGSRARVEAPEIEKFHLSEEMWEGHVKKSHEEKVSN